MILAECKKVSTNRSVSQITLFFLCFLVCQWPVLATSTSNNQPLKVGFLYVSPVNDKGWSYYHDQGRIYLQQALKGKVETICVESIPENAEAERVMEKMIARGCKLIFTTSYGYLEPVLKISAKHSDVMFMQVGRVASQKNLGSYVYSHYEPTYLGGVVAGHLTKSNKMGYVGMLAVPVVLESLNSFALGVHSVNPKAKIKVVWTNTWSDAVLEIEAARSLIETGADVLAVPQSPCSPVFKLAESKDVKLVGCFTDIKELSPKQWLTGVKFNWGPFYKEIAQSVINHTWQGKTYLCDMKNGVVDLAPFGPSVPNTVRQEVLGLKEKIKAGKLVVFAGPLRDSQGKIRLPAGEKPSIDWLSKMNFFVPGIDGNLSKN